MLSHSKLSTQLVVLVAVLAAPSAFAETAPATQAADAANPSAEMQVDGFHGGSGGFGGGGFHGGGDPVHTGGGFGGGGFHGGGDPVHNGGGFHGGAPIHTGGGFHGPITGGDHGGFDGHGHPFQHDPHGNFFDSGHDERLNFTNGRAQFMQHDGRIDGYVNDRVNFYNEHYEPIARGCWDHYNGAWGAWHAGWTGWYGCGFHGGYYWGLNPFWGMDTYYYVPGIYWFYNNDWNDYYYTTWYGSDYAAWPAEYRTPFKHAGAFFPTEEFRDLNLDLSGASMQTQIEYRRAMTALDNVLATEVTARGGDGILTQGSIVINHFELMLDSQAVEVEGFVSEEGIDFPFSAILYLQTPEQPEVFIPGQAGPGANESQPAPSEQQQLLEFNAHLTDLGGGMVVTH